MPNSLRQLFDILNLIYLRQILGRDLVVASHKFHN